MSTVCMQDGVQPETHVFRDGSGRILARHVILGINYHVDLLFPLPVRGPRWRFPPHASTNDTVTWTHRFVVTRDRSDELSILRHTIAVAPTRSQHRDVEAHGYTHLLKTDDERQDATAWHLVRECRRGCHRSRGTEESDGERRKEMESDRERRRLTDGKTTLMILMISIMIARDQVPRS